MTWTNFPKKCSHRYVDCIKHRLTVNSIDWSSYRFQYIIYSIDAHLLQLNVLCKSGKGNKRNISSTFRNDFVP